jgi:dihydrolipoamide dehydrogenase
VAEGAGIDLLRGSGRLAGAGVVEVDGVAHTTVHVVVATGSDPVMPPVPGLAELDGVWSSREATGMTAVPRRLVVLGAGPVGVEMAQAVRRLGGEVVVVDASEHVLGREPVALGTALGEVLRSDGIELVLGVHATAARREGEDYVLDLDDGSRQRGDRLLVATGRRPRVAGLGLETVGVAVEGEGIPVDRRLRAAEGVWAIGDVNGRWPLTHVGKYEGEVVAANILGEAREASYEAVPARDLHRSAGGGRRRRRGALQRHRPARRGRQDGHLHAGVRTLQRVPDPAQRRGAADRCPGVRPRGR